MTSKTKQLILLISVLLLPFATQTALASCSDTGVALQVLGSGGPFGAGRASAGYIVWIDGESRIMVDAGGGTFARFHEAGASVSDLKVMALSHFHPDHSSEVPALLWVQPSDLLVAGPSGSEGFPSVDEFLDALFAPPKGAFRVIGSYLEANTVTVDVSAETATMIYSDDQFTIRGIGVPHGNVPAVGFRVDIGDSSIAFSSDQNGTNAAYAELAKDVDVLVIHFAASEQAPQMPSSLHARPSVWGQMASDANAGSVIVSHISKPKPAHPGYPMQSGSDLEGNVEHLRSRYEGPVTIAEDLLCIPVK